MGFGQEIVIGAGCNLGVIVADRFGYRLIMQMPHALLTLRPFQDEVAEASQIRTTHGTRGVPLFAD